MTRTKTRALANWPNNAVSVLDYGAVGDGVTDDTAAIQAAFDSGNKYVIAPAGDYLISDFLTVPDGVTFKGAGPDLTVIKANPTATPTKTEDAWISKVGVQPTQISSLSLDVSEGGRLLTFTGNHGLSVGDLVLIYNETDYSFSGYRPVYRAGEYCEVIEVVSASEVNLHAPLCDSYVAAEVKVFSCKDYASGDFSDFKVIGKADKASRDLCLEFCRGVNIHNVQTTGSQNASMAVNKSYDIDVRAVHCELMYEDIDNTTRALIPLMRNEKDMSTEDMPNLFQLGYGSCYGLAIGNSHKINIQGTFKSVRHAITHGGGADWAVPCRFSHTYDSFLESDPRGEVPAYDTHGNSEYCSVDNITCQGGFSIGGNHISLRNSTFIGAETAQGLCQYAEMQGADFIVENCYVKSYYTSANRGILDVGGNSISYGSEARKGGTFVIRNLRLIAPNHKQFGVVFRNRGADQVYDVILQNISYTADITSTTYGPCYVDSESGFVPRKIEGTGLTSTGPIGQSRLYVGAGEQSDSLIKGDSESGSQEILVTSGSKVTVGAPSDFHYIFPKPPTMSLAITPASSSDGTVFTPSLYAVPSKDGYRLRVYGVDNANVDTTFTVQWTAMVNDF